ncbi:MAG: acyl carrier protein [Clostridia bacterium]|nr:acyl carrier protein [Clostridia bacterium]
METQEQVVKILEELSGNTNINSNDHLQNDLGLDSLDLVNLLVCIEDEFEIELDESDMNPFDFETVESVVNMVEKYI